MEYLKILIVVLCFVAFGAWAAWVSVRPKEGRDEKKSAQDQPPLPDT